MYTACNLEVIRYSYNCCKRIKEEEGALMLHAGYDLGLVQDTIPKW